MAIWFAFLVELLYEIVTVKDKIVTVKDRCPILAVCVVRGVRVCVCMRACVCVCAIEYMLSMITTVVCSNSDIDIK